MHELACLNARQLACLLIGYHKLLGMLPSLLCRQMRMLQAPAHAALIGSAGRRAGAARMRAAATRRRRQKRARGGIQSARGVGLEAAAAGPHAITLG